MRTETKKFIDYVIKDCKEYNVKVIFAPSKGLRIVEESYLPVDGFFDGSIIKVATKKPLSEWLPILIHEYSHFLQQKRNTDIHKKYQSCSDVLINWPKTKPNPSILKEALRTAYCYESECEQIAITVLKKFDLPLNISDYIRNANMRLYATLYEALYQIPYPIWYTDEEFNSLVSSNTIKRDYEMSSQIKNILEQHK